MYAFDVITTTGRCFVALRSEKGTGISSRSPQSNTIPALIVISIPERKIPLSNETQIIDLVWQQNNFNKMMRLELNFRKLTAFVRFHNQSIDTHVFVSCSFPQSLTET